MRVALDATPLLGPRTGVGAFTHGALTALAGLAGKGGEDDDLRLLAYALSWRAGASLAAVLPAGVGRPRPNLPMPPEVVRKAWVRLDWPGVEWWTGPVDVVHGTNFVVPPAKRAAEVVTIHDLTPVRFPELCAADPLSYPPLLRRALGRGAWAHVPSSFVAGEVVDLLGAEPERVVVVAEGVPMVADAVPGRGRDLAGFDRYVLLLGTIEPRKDHPLAVRAFDLVAADRPELGLVIAGSEAWGSGALDVAVAAARHGERIRRLGWVDDAQRAALLRDASALAFPSRYEGFGLPPLEAMSVGVPVVATRTGAVAEVVDDAALLVTPGDPDAFAAALARVLDDVALTDQLVAAGRERAARYTWEACAQGLMALYVRAVEAGR